MPDWRMRVIRLLLFLCSVTLLDCAPTGGQESTPSPRECENPQTTAAMRRCEIARYDQATAGMTAAYHALMAKLDQGGQAKLRLAQNAWLEFRDAEADFQADSARGGTLAPLIRTSVLADLTESRREQLLKQAKQTAR